MTPPLCLKNAHEIQLKKGQRIFSSGDVCEAFYYVLSGSVRIDLLSRTGKSVLLYRFGADDVCTLTASCLMAGENYSAQALVEEDGKALWVSAAEFESLLKTSDEFRKIVFSAFSHRLSDMMLKMEDIAFSPLDKRLAVRLSDLADKNQHITATHEQLAADLGSSREVISRRLALWEKDGFIKRERGGLQITLPTELHKMRTLGD